MSNGLKDLRAGTYVRTSPESCRMQKSNLLMSYKNRLPDIETKRLNTPDRTRSTLGVTTVLVLKPRRKTYVEHGRFTKGMRATSKLLPGFSVNVTTALGQKPEIPK